MLVALTMPFLSQVGPLMFTVDRFLVLLAFVACLVIWLRGGAGRLHLTDFALLAIWAWMALADTVNHGIATSIEGSGINLVETIGAYLIARCFVLDADAFLSVMRFLFGIILVLLSFSLYETLTAHILLLDIANRIWPSYLGEFKERRLGFDRVRPVFLHTILDGVFCCACFAPALYVLSYNASTVSRAWKTGIVGLATFVSLSSGPLSALTAQMGLIFWDLLLRTIWERWILLAGGILFVVVALEIAASRSTPQIFIDYFALEPRTAYNILRIGEYGTPSVANHPWFGLRRGAWERPDWMVASIDMFWLVPAVRHGMPAAIFLHVAFWAVFLSVAFRRNLAPRAGSYSTAYLICLMGFYLAGWTVHYWKSLYLFFMFFLGAGHWILCARSEEAERVSDPTLVQEPAVRGGGLPVPPAYAPPAPRDGVAPAAARGDRHPAPGRGRHPSERASAAAAADRSRSPQSRETTCIPTRMGGMRRTEEIPAPSSPPTPRVREWNS